MPTFTKLNDLCIHSLNMQETFLAVSLSLLFISLRLSLYWAGLGIQTAYNEQNILFFSHCTLQDGSLFVLYISTATPIIQESPFTGRLEIPFYVKTRVFFFCRLISHSELTFRMYRISALLGLWTSSTSMMSPDPYIHVGYVNVWKAFQRFTL